LRVSFSLPDQIEAAIFRPNLLFRIRLLSGSEFPGATEL
jgi:hypothetical protein